eukprot:COSAG01_NODE_8014_length_2953_cov_14.818851_1_plen_99_part_00
MALPAAAASAAAVRAACLVCWLAFLPVCWSPASLCLRSPISGAVTLTGDHVTPRPPRPQAVFLEDEDEEGNAAKLAAGACSPTYGCGWRSWDRKNVES